MGNDEDNLILQKSENLKFEFTKEGYFENQLIEGILNFQNNKEMKIDEISINIRIIESYNLLESKNKITNSFQKKIFSKKFNLPKIFHTKNTKNIPIPSALHRIPFRLFLPKNIPPSFEYPRENKKGYIRYIFTGEVISGEEKYITEEYLIIKQRPFDFPPQTRLKIQDKKVIQTEASKLKGESGISIFTPNKNIIINDPIKFEVDIDNTKCEEDIIKINSKVVRKVIFKKDKDLYNSESIIINKKYPIKCLKGEKKRFNYEDLILKDIDLKDLYFPDKLNPYLGKIKDLNLLMPSLDSPIIKCEYKLEISSEFDTNIVESSRPNVVIPIYVGHQSPQECNSDKIIIQAQIKNIPRDFGIYAPVYNFKEENNNNRNNNNGANELGNNNNFIKNNFKNNYENSNYGNNNFGNNNFKNINNNNFGNIPDNNFNNNFYSEPFPSGDQNENSYPIISCNDYPTLESINREMNRREMYYLYNGNNNQKGNNLYNPYDNISL